MIIKEIGIIDVPKIVELMKQQSDFIIPNLDNCVVDRIVYEHDTPIAYGIVREMSEAIIVVNYEVPKITRMRAFIELMKVALIGAKEKGHDQLHVFVKDERLVNLLKSKFGFEQTTDTVLVRNL